MRDPHMAALLDGMDGPLARVADRELATGLADARSARADRLVLGEATARRRLEVERREAWRPGCSGLDSQVG